MSTEKDREVAESYAVSQIDELEGFTEDEVQTYVEFAKDGN